MTVSPTPFSGSTRAIVGKAVAAAIPLAERLVGAAGGSSRRREFCHFADSPSRSLLKHLLNLEEGAAE